MKEDEIIYNIQNELDKLIDINKISNFSFTKNFFIESMNNYHRPDMIIHDRIKDKYILIEIKATENNYRIPISTLSQLKSLKKINQFNNPLVILIYKGIIPNSISEQLKDEGILTFQYTNSKEIANKIAELIVNT